MHIIEKNLFARTGHIEDCEDRIVVTDWFAGVIDGVTFKGADNDINKTPGQIAADLICKEVNGFPQNISGFEAIRSLTKSISEYCMKNYPSKLVVEYKRRIAASVAIYSKFRREVWSVGDCQVLVGNRLIVNKSSIDRTMANARVLYLQSEILRGKSVNKLIEYDTGREFIKPLLDHQQLFLNSSKSSGFAYTAICGIPLPESFSIETIDITDEITEIVLATDGYPKVEQTLKSSEDKLTVILEQDPLCMDIVKSTKGLKKGNVSFDDRAYLRIDVRK